MLAQQRHHLLFHNMSVFVPPYTRPPASSSSPPLQTSSLSISSSLSSSPSRQRHDLKIHLLSLLESSQTLSDDCMSLISSLQQLNPCLDISSSSSGCFEGIKSSFKGTGRKGEANSDIGAAGSSVTLGRATFNSLKPRDLDIILRRSYNHVAVEEPDRYNLILEFDVIDDGQQNIVEGLLINSARFSIASASRMDVVFATCTMKMRNSEDKEKRERWLKLFKEANPGMDERGSITVALPPAKGYLDFLYMDEELRITRGNRGGVAVMRRLAERVVHL